MYAFFKNIIRLFLISLNTSSLLYIEIVIQFPGYLSKHNKNNQHMTKYCPHFSACVCVHVRVCLTV